MFNILLFDKSNHHTRCSVNVDAVVLGVVDEVGQGVRDGERLSE